MKTNPVQAKTTNNSQRNSKGRRVHVFFCGLSCVQAAPDGEGIRVHLTDASVGGDLNRSAVRLV